MRFYVTEAPLYSCLQVAKVAKGSGAINCADCDQPLLLLSPEQFEHWPLPVAEDTVDENAIEWDEYLEASIPETALARAVDRACQAHTCHPTL